jgi:predicted transposase YbfD/YdcC
MGKFEKVFRGLPDPRADNAQHELVDILFIALAALLCGAETCSDMAEFGCAKEELFRQILGLKHGIPSHDTFSRVFRLLDPQAFAAAFQRFMAAFATANKLDLTGVIAIDGKALRGAFERGRRTTPLHMVNVWAADARMVLAQRKAPGRNEVAGALELLGLLSLDGCIVTADALHCHRAMAVGVLDRGGQYLLALKENQSALFAAVKRCFARGGQRSIAERLEPSTHDRREQRRATVIRNTSLASEHDFPGIAAVARITSRRRLHGGSAEPPVVRFFLLSQYLSARKLLHIQRSHWSVENQLHWVLDVVLDEDNSRSRKDHGPENLALLRGFALNILRSHPDATPLRRKIKRAGWDNAFLVTLLAHMQ